MSVVGVELVVGEGVVYGVDAIERHGFDVLNIALITRSGCCSRSAKSWALFILLQSAGRLLLRDSPRSCDLSLRNFELDRLSLFGLALCKSVNIFRHFLSRFLAEEELPLRHFGRFLC